MLLGISLVDGKVGCGGFAPRFPLCPRVSERRMLEFLTNPLPSIAGGLTAFNGAAEIKISSFSVIDE